MVFIAELTGFYIYPNKTVLDFFLPMSTNAKFANCFICLCYFGGRLEHKNIIAFIILECGRQRLWEIIECMSKNEILNTCNLI